MEPLITVIIPGPGKADHFAKCISSVVNQTYSNLEIVLIDKEWTETSLKNIERYLHANQHIKVVDTSQHPDWRQNVHGKYVVCVNPDGWIDTCFVESMLNVFKYHSVDMVECQCAYYTYQNRQSRIAYDLTSELQILKRKEYIKLLVENNDQVGSYLWRKMIKKSALPATFFSSKTEVEKEKILAQILTNVNTVAYIAKPLYFCRLVKEYKTSATFNDLQTYYSNLLKLEPDLKVYIEKQKMIKYLSLLKQEINNLPAIDDYLKNRLVNYIKTSQLKRGPLDYQALKLLLSLFPNKQSLAINIWLKIILVYQRLWDSKINKHLHLIGKYKNLFLSRKKQFIILGEIDFGNLGDRAIELAEHQFITQYFNEYEQVGVMLNDINVIKLLHFFIKKGSILAVQGGGNLGTLYPWISERITKILIPLRARPVVIFPQTYYFSKDESGEATKSKLRGVYGEMRNFQIFTRDPQSFELVSKELYKTTSLVPDMALILKPVIKNYSRENILIILRDDQEKTLTMSEQRRIISSVKQQAAGKKIVYADTHVHYDGLSKRFAQRRINELWDKYFQAKIVITDRLHGMIFAAITNTPCIVLLSQSPKIKGVYSQWLKENDYIELVEKLDDLPKAIRKVTSVKNPQLKRDKIDAAFGAMAEQIKKIMVKGN